jgi:hypothetical protein
VLALLFMRLPSRATSSPFGLHWCSVRVSNSYSNGGASSINGKSCAVNEPGTVCCQDDNRFCYLVGRSRTTRRRLGS